MFIMEVFLVITEQDNRDILLSSLIPLSARCYAELWVPAERCMQLAGARTAKPETTAKRTLTTVSEPEACEKSVGADVF